MNILLTSVGRRNYIVDYFKEALASVNGKVFAINSELDSAAMWRADEYAASPVIYSHDYAGFLLSYCLENDITLVVSLFDVELPVLSRLKADFARKGITIVVADTWVTETANDKWRTLAFLKRNGFAVKNNYLSLNRFRMAFEKDAVSFPVFVKPRWGMGSIGLYKAYDEKDLAFYFDKVKKDISKSYLKYESAADRNNSVLIQEALPGEEYGLDVINDLNGNYCNTVVKKKLAMRSGETDAAITVNEPILAELGEKLSALTRHPANMDVDVFFDGQTPYVLEINPRFGGGYPFSHAAGMNLPLAIVKWHRNEPVDVNSLLSPKTGIKSMKGISIISESRKESSAILVSEETYSCS